MVESFASAHFASLVISNTLTTTGNITISCFSFDREENSKWTFHQLQEKINTADVVWRVGCRERVNELLGTQDTPDANVLNVSSSNFQG